MQECSDLNASGLEAMPRQLRPDDNEEEEDAFEEDMDDYFKDTLKHEIALKSLSRSGSEREAAAAPGRSHSRTSSLTAILSGGDSPRSPVKMSDEDIDNLKLDAKLKKYQLNLSKSPVNTPIADNGAAEAAKSNGFSFSRPQFRVPFFFK